MMKHQKKESAIVFSVTSDLVFAVASVIMDLKRTSSVLPDDIVVFHDGIGRKDSLAINSIFPVVKKKYELPVKHGKFNQDTLSYFSKMILAKFECLNLLNDYKTVLFLDYDQVIMGDISNLLDTPKCGLRMLESDGALIRQLFLPIKNMNMDIKAYCASVMVFSDNIGDYNQMYRWCYEKAVEYSKYLYIPDQAIYAMLFDEFKITPEIIRLKDYCCHPTDSNNIKTAKIIHAYGQPKFWNGIDNAQWKENYQNWLLAGGSVYNAKNLKRMYRLKMARLKKKLPKLKLFITSLFKKNVD